MRPRVAGSILMDIGERYDVLLSFCHPSKQQHEDYVMKFFPYDSPKTGNSFRALFRVTGDGSCPGVLCEGRLLLKRIVTSEWCIVS